MKVAGKARKHGKARKPGNEKTNEKFVENLIKVYTK
jgi:hypothetical protein